MALLHKLQVGVRVALVAFLAPVVAEGADDLAPLLQPVLEGSDLPSIAAAVVSREGLEGSGAVGFRKLGDPTAVTVHDHYHIGSCTKTMTATLVANLVEQGRIDWATTVGEVLGGAFPGMHPGYEGVTVEQLLAHTSGIAAEPPADAWATAWRNQGRVPPEEQRWRFVRDVLETDPIAAPGARPIYSNQGYAVLGVMLEEQTGRPWELLMKERLFVPLGMVSAGFRSPRGEGELDQPWGHREGAPVPPEPAGDNPDAIAPAGGVHLSIRDWAKFARFHLRRESGGVLGDAASFERLHATLEGSGSHGVGGWIVHDLARFGGHCLQMTGSNTMWFALFWILPARDLAVVVATNAAGEGAFPTCDKVAGILINRYTTKR